MVTDKQKSNNCDVNCSCPIENTLSLIGKKWSINLIRDMFMGKKRFTEFLESNKDLSSKMLSRRLKDLQRHCLIEKTLVSKDPIVIEYHLTERGKGLNKVLHELALFSAANYPENIGIKPEDFENFKKTSKKMFSA